jgi:hypothetical protein
MTLEQAQELEVNRRMLIRDEADILGIDFNVPKYKHLANAISAWAEAVADLRSHQSVEERMVAAAEATQRYVTEKRT